MTHGRHHETLRGTTASILLAIVAGILGLIGGGHLPLGRALLPLTLFLFLLGVFGVFFTMKYHERYAFHLNRAREYRNRLEERLSGGSELIHYREKADKKTKNEYPRLNSVQLHVFWELLNGIVALFGLVLTLLIAFGWTS